MRRKTVSVLVRILAVVSLTVPLGEHFAWALPTGGQVAGGAAAIKQPSAGTLHVEQFTDRALLDWHGFSIGTGETVQFFQPSAASLAVNRVLGGDPSVILGSLIANGRVFLLNPNGMVFGPGSVVNVGGLLASTLGLQSYDLNKGQFSFAQDPTKALAPVVNQGTLRIADHGFVVLAAPGVVNDGLIVAKFGQVGLGAGTQMTVDFRGDGLIQYAVGGVVRETLRDVEGRTLEAAVSNAGRIEADGGTVLLTAQASSAVVSSVVNQTGVIQARRLESQGGEIVLRGGDEGWMTVAGRLDATGREKGETGEKSEKGGTIEIAGNRLFLLGEAHADGTNGGRITVQAERVIQASTLTADGSIGDGGVVSIAAAKNIIQTESAFVAARGGETGVGGAIVLQAGDAGGVFTSGTLLATGQRGGTIHVLGGNLTLAAATGDASGVMAGGTILIGGDYQGRGEVPRAATTMVSPLTTLKADARERGHGGKIIIWSDNQTEFYGNASVRGGAQGGDGGLIEVSSKNALFFGGSADAGASAGKPGQVLLDPKFITISASGSIPQFIITDPAYASEVDSVDHDFGATVVPLTTGNLVITADTAFGGVGTVYLFNGQTGGLISTLVGTSFNDQISSGGITALTNGHFVIASPNWDRPGVGADAGAVTWGNGTTGINGVVSASNSLVGGTLSDQVGSSGVTALTNGNYVVRSPNWDNPVGPAANAGAVTWGNGTTGITGPVSTANSLVGSTADDGVGFVTVLTNGNYVVRSPLWNGGNANIGAVTWMNGATGKDVNNATGVVGTSNSLVGTTADDGVGNSVTALTNGNYVVRSPLWNGTNADIGAVTWMNGATGKDLNNAITAVGTGNSLVGGTLNDQVGSGVVIALTNGHFVVTSPNWDRPGVAVDAGAVTWGNGTTGINGVVSASNSLVGGTLSDQVGSSGVTALTNGNYVVRSPNWDALGPPVVQNVGAVTWMNGATGRDVNNLTGPVGTGNSLIGTTAGDGVGTGVTALTNGHYVVRSPSWNGAKDDIGAVTWMNGATGKDVNNLTGAVGTGNSFVGTTAGDGVGSGGVTALTNGNYVILSPNWDQSTTLVMDVGAATWQNGTTGSVGQVFNSGATLFGSSTLDQVGLGAVALTNGNYVVLSRFWNGAGGADVGAATWGNGTTGIAGAIFPTNSLVGTTPNDQIGSSGVTALSNGHYLVRSPNWDNGGLADAGAVTWGSGTKGVTGSVSTANSIVGGGVAIGGEFLGSTVRLDNVNGTYLVGEPFGGDFDRIIAGFQDPASGVTFASGGGQSMTIGASFLSKLLETSPVILQASTDLTMAASAVVQPTSGSFGLTFQSGRSVTLGANSQVILNGGDFLAKINDEAVVANRDAGTAQFTMNGGALGAQIVTNGGDVTVDVGTFGGSQLGIVRIGDGIEHATISSAAGNISITGRGNSPIIVNKGTLQSTTGSITLTGTGTNGTGISLVDSGINNFTMVTTNQGDITLTGTTSAGNSNQVGIEVSGGASVTSSLGSITLIGGGNGGPGIRVTSSGEIGGNSFTGGPITLRAGTSTAADSLVLSNVQIQTAGTITLEPLSPGDSIGIAGGAGEFNLSVAELNLMDPLASMIIIGRSDGTGAVTFGTSAGPIGYTFQSPVTIRSSLAGGAGSITVNGPLATAGSDSLTLEASAALTVAATAPLTTGSGAMSLTADQLALNGPANSVQGTGPLLLQPRQAGISVGLGNGASGLFNLTTTELLALKDGFSGITIGRSDGQHVIDIRSVTFRDPLTIRSPFAPGSITVSGTVPGTGLTGTGNASITLIGSGVTTFLNGDIVTNGQPIFIDGNVVVAGGFNITRRLDTTGGGIFQGGANITVTGTILAQNAEPNNESLAAIAGTNGDVTFQSEIGGISPGGFPRPLRDLSATGSADLDFDLLVPANNVRFKKATMSGTFTAAGQQGDFGGQITGGVNGEITLVFVNEDHLAANIISGNRNITHDGPIVLEQDIQISISGTGIGNTGRLTLRNTVNPTTPFRVNGQNHNLTLYAPKIDFEAPPVESMEFPAGSGNIVSFHPNSGSIIGFLNGVATNNVLTIGPSPTLQNLNIAMGGMDCALQVCAQELDRIVGGPTGFQTVRLGRADSAASITIGNYTTPFPLLVQTGPAGSITVTGALSTSGVVPIGLTLEAGKNIVLTPGASVTTNNGPLTLTANVGGAGAGNFVGIDVNGATLNSGTAALQLTGRGGNADANNSGVRMQGGSTVTTTSGPVTITGFGGAGTDIGNRGVDILGTGTQVSSSTGPITIHGTGGSNTSFSFGVAMAQGHVTSGGDISITGVGGAGGPSNVATLGMLITNAAQVQGTGNAKVTITGTGGTGTSTSATNGEVGVFMHGQNGTFIRTEDGELKITGTGNGTGIGGQGVILRGGALIEGVGSGKVEITGNGSVTGSANNNGIQMIEAGTTVKTKTGNIALTGTAHGVLNSTNNIGIAIASGALVQKTDPGGFITITGTGGDGGGGVNNFGVGLLSSTTQILASNGTITIAGFGGTGGTAGLTAQNGFIISPGIPCGPCNSTANINAGGGVVTISSTP